MTRCLWCGATSHTTTGCDSPRAMANAPYDRAEHDAAVAVQRSAPVHYNRLGVLFALPEDQ